MIGSALLVIMTWLAPDGFLLGTHLQSPDDLPVLPLKALIHTSAFLDIEPSLRPGAPHVLYVGRGPETQGLWPRLRYAPAVFASDAGNFQPRHRLGLDVVEYWVHGLALAWLDERRRAGDPYIELAAQRAPLVMPEVPQDVRLQVYLETVADFVSQAVSVAHEVDRSRRRWQGLGRDVCQLRQGDLPLMRHWRGLFERASFRGIYPVKGAAAGPADSDDRFDPPPAADGSAAVHERLWATTQGELERADKDLIVQHLFAGIWHGDPERDFAALCEDT